MTNNVSQERICNQVMEGVKIQGHSLSEWVDIIGSAVCAFDGIIDRGEVRRDLNRLYDSLPDAQKPAILKAIEVVESAPDITQCCQSPKEEIHD